MLAKISLWGLTFSVPLVLHYSTFAPVVEGYIFSSVVGETSTQCIPNVDGAWSFLNVMLKNQTHKAFHIKCLLEIHHILSIDTAQT